ncbi:MAG: hypothetical protein U1D55_00825 [Phycisphaerae bacterium]
MFRQIGFQQRVTTNATQQRRGLAPRVFASLAIVLFLNQAVQAGQTCFDLKGTATGAGSVGVSVDGDNYIEPVVPGDTACAVLGRIKANFDATAPAGSNASSGVTQRPDGTCDWCITRHRNQKPAQSSGRGVGAAGMGRTPGFSQLSVRYVPNPPPAPAPVPVTIHITVNVFVPLGGAVRIRIEIIVNNVIQPFDLNVPTFPGMTPDMVNQQIMQTLISAGFQVQHGVEEFPLLGTRPSFDIVGHVSGGELHGAELETFDNGLREWGLTMTSPAVPCPGDLTGDGIVDEADLGVLLGDFRVGPAGDLNGDGITDEADLGILLANWRLVCP